MKLLDTKARYQEMERQMEESFRKYCDEHDIIDGDGYEEEDEYDDIRQKEEEARHEWHEKIVDEFVSSHMISKEEVIREIDRLIEEEKKQLMKETDEREIIFEKTYITLIMKFRAAIDRLILLNNLDDFWGYGYEIDDESLRLKLLTYSHPDMDENIEFNPIQEFILCEIKPQMLTVEEYAQRYGVKAVTVRQWIRRGKIRTAQKWGKEWRISELLVVKSRGYQSGFYKWNIELDNLPKEWDFMSECNAVTVRQQGAGSFVAAFYKRGVDSTMPYREYEIDDAERAKLEIMLISNPFVKGTDSSGHIYEACE